MFLIYCPYCKENRTEEEFHPSGEAHLKRSTDPMNASDKEWGEYLYFRNNPRGLHTELWQHSIGCRKYFIIKRDTASYEIIESYIVGGKATRKSSIGEDQVSIES